MFLNIYFVKPIFIIFSILTKEQTFFKLTMSSKFEIKSKKQKLNDKKFSKGNTPPLVDLIQSSDDSHYRNNQKIEKRSKFSGKSINKKDNNQEPKQYQPKTLDLTRVRNAIVENKKLAQKIVFTTSAKNENQYDSLLVVETDVQQNPDVNSRQRSLFSYKIEGKQGIKFISQSHMKGRITSQLKDIQTKQNQKLQKQEQRLEKIMQGGHLSDQQEKTKKNKKEGVQGAQPIERKRAARYFQEMESDDEAVQNIVKCFRCYKKGHIAKNCIEQEPKQSCNFCLQQHHYSVCDTSPCFRCTLPGHISQDCQSKAIECRKCKKRGHKSERCGVYLPLDYHNKDQDYIKSRFNKSDLKKLKCLRSCKNPTGHFNCFSYESTKEPLPYSSSNNSNTNKKVFYERENHRYRR